MFNNKWVNGNIPIIRIPKPRKDLGNPSKLSFNRTFLRKTFEKKTLIIGFLVFLKLIKNYKFPVFFEKELKYNRLHGLTAIYY